MVYHGLVVGPDGQSYECWHNHRTETAAFRCANSSATRRMAEAAWNRAAMQAEQAAARANRGEEERAAAEPRWVAARVASAAGRAKARAAAGEAKAARRAARLAAMSQRRAWKRMTPEERLLRTAEAELAVYGEILSPDAKSAHDIRAAKRAAADWPGAPGCVPPGTSVRARRLAVGRWPGVKLWSRPALLRARVTGRFRRTFENNAGIVRLVVVPIAMLLLVVLLTKLGALDSSGCGEPVCGLPSSPGSGPPAPPARPPAQSPARAPCPPPRTDRQSGPDAVAYSPDGTTLAAGGSGGSVDLWSAASGRLLATLTDPGWHQGQCGSVQPGRDDPGRRRH
jgi:hypothetical protein